jgi:AraC-like DNA-binding protein
MDGLHARFMVRSDYAHALAEACQRFTGSILSLQPRAFVRAAAQLAADAPEPRSAAESLLEWSRISATFVRGAYAHHRWFHDHFDRGTCDFEPTLLPLSPPSAKERIASLVIASAETCADRFAQVHRWPAATRAAALLDERPDRHWYIDELATITGTSAASLERSFSEIYGMSPQPYQALIRVRRVAAAIRQGAGSLDGLLVEAGWRSPKNAYRAFRKIAGMTPAGVRQLGEAEFEALMHGPLWPPVPRPIREQRASNL